jgi:hypothetical protein
MTTNRSVGFQGVDGNGERARQRRTTAITELFLTLALAVSTAIAATAVSVEMAHAATFEQTAHHSAPALAVALLGGLGCHGRAHRLRGPRLRATCLRLMT